MRTRRRKGGFVHSSMLPTVSVLGSVAMSRVPSRVKEGTRALHVRALPLYPDPPGQRIEQVPLRALVKHPQATGETPVLRQVPAHPTNSAIGVPSFRIASGRFAAS